jgi:hypothetical protein
VSYLTVNPGIRPHDGVNDFGITLTGVDLYNGGVRVGSIAVTAFDAPSVTADIASVWYIENGHNAIK